MKIAGGWLLAFALFLMVGALMYQPTVSTGGYSSGLYDLPSETYNLGKLQYQELFFMAGCAFMIAGSVLLAVGVLVERLEQSGVLKPVPAVAIAIDSTTNTPCDWCGVNVPAPNKPCSAINPDRWPEIGPRIQAPRCKEELHGRGLLEG